MIYREAKVEDIKGIQAVRKLAHEYALLGATRISDKKFAEYITTNGKGWVCEVDGTIVGFSIVDLKGNSIWALFVKPQFEKQGIGKQLYTLMMDWYFDQTKESIWHTTSLTTKSEQSYTKLGWVNQGKNNVGETKFEMTYKNWIQNG
ncbi:MAG: GNAT family N-acetyltransferase [Bacteroidota bacterium]|nr:GNAT family N-acetyltransferase [Bacteroidota bacterium]MDP3144830.1 GNAT family N-acetyltransferase [Bacteroidota bacterium]MDP3557799.1 GNAT family N-acetyltransferase [Bacteroidota bacterium]